MFPKTMFQPAIMDAMPAMATNSRENLNRVQAKMMAILALQNISAAKTTPSAGNTLFLNFFKTNF
jgi:hypothetical protein